MFGYSQRIKKGRGAGLETGCRNSRIEIGKEILAQQISPEFQFDFWYIPKQAAALLHTTRPGTRPCDYGNNCSELGLGSGR